MLTILNIQLSNYIYRLGYVRLPTYFTIIKKTLIVETKNISIFLKLLFSIHNGT